MLKRIAQAVALIAVLGGPALAQETLCPPLKPLAEGADDHRVREADFTSARFSEALAYFKEDLSRRLAEAKASEHVTEREGFWIGYDNSVKILEGYALRQAALLEHASKAGVRGPATQKFCDFLSKTRYLD